MRSIVMVVIAVFLFVAAGPGLANIPAESDLGLLPYVVALNPDARYFLTDQGFSELIDPVCCTNTDVQVMLGRCRRTIAFLDNLEAACRDGIRGLPPTLPRGLLSIRALAARYVTYVGPDEALPNGAGLVDLRTSQDPAINRLRHEVGIPAPRGYVYLRMYPTLDRAPKEIRDQFTDRNKSGTTLGGRFIVIVLSRDRIAESERVISMMKQHPELKNFLGLITADQSMPKEMLESTISHELVHAYLATATGKDAKILPEWFQEGCAIYFSGSGKTHTKTVSTPVGTGTIRFTEIDQYREYRQAFEFLAQKMGSTEFNRRLVMAVRMQTPESLLAGVGDTSFRAVVAEAAHDRFWRSVRTAGIIGGAVLFLIIVVSLKQR